MIDLSLVHPTLLSKINTVLFQMHTEGHPMRICQAVRTVDEQYALYQHGRTLPGKIVTNCDGELIKSNHQIHADGLGHAVDCCFTTGDPFGETQPWARYGALVVTAGLVWGGNFHSIVDRPHAELP